AISKAVLIGDMPALKARMMRFRRFLCAHLVAASVTILLGSSILNNDVIIATNAPIHPLALMPTFQPSNAMYSILGPGAVWASVMDELNCISVSQCLLFTRKV